jgi:hypothetical protein
MKRICTVVMLLICAVGLALGEDIVESRSGTRFAAKDEDTSLLGIGLRTKTIAKVKVYAIGLYVADSAIAGPLKDKAGRPELYRELVAGDFRKKVVLKFVRDVSADQIRDAFRDALKGAGAKVEEWIAYFTDLRSGQECVISWVPGVGLETKVAGVERPPINDKAFGSAVFGIWLGEKPIQEDIKRDLVARAGSLMK